MGAPTVAEFLDDGLFALLLAVTAIWGSWAWALILAGVPGAMLLRRRLARRPTLTVGGASALVALAANTGVLGAGLRADPDFASGIYPPYLLGLVLATCWLTHSLLGLAAIWLGCLLAEAVRPA